MNLLPLKNLSSKPMELQVTLYRKFSLSSSWKCCSTLLMSTLIAGKLSNSRPGRLAAGKKIVGGVGSHSQSERLWRKKNSCCYRISNPGPSNLYLFVDYALQASQTMYSQTRHLVKAWVLNSQVAWISDYFGIYAVTTFT
jgi:hypothetical protein